MNNGDKKENAVNPPSGAGGMEYDFRRIEQEDTAIKRHPNPENCDL